MAANCGGQLRLARTLRTSAGVGRNVRRSSPVRRHHVSCRQLDLRRSHARLRAQQRSLHRAQRVPQGDVPDATGTAAGSPAMPLLGAPAADVPLPSLLQEFRIPDHTRDQGRKFRLAVLLAIWQWQRLPRRRSWRPVISLSQCAPWTRGATSAPGTTIHPPAPPSILTPIPMAGGPGPLARCACSRDHSTGRRWQAPTRRQPPERGRVPDRVPGQPPRQTADRQPHLHREGR